MIKRILSILLALLLCAAVCIGTAEQAGSALEKSDFTCTMANGGAFTLHDHLGKVVLINFWTTWCGPCRTEMPAINELAAYYAQADDVTILTVNLGDKIDVVQKFLEDNGYTLPVACDVNNAVALLYGVYNIPATVIFDKNGDVNSAWIGVSGEIDEICPHIINIIEGLR